MPAADAVNVDTVVVPLRFNMRDARFVKAPVPTNDVVIVNPDPLELSFERVTPVTVILSNDITLLPSRACEFVLNV